MNDNSNRALISIAKPLPNWSLENITEKEAPKREDFLGKALLILFFNLGCPGCLGRALPYANRVVFENTDSINVLGIHTHFEGAEFTTQQFNSAKEEFHIRFPIYKDRYQNETFMNYGAGGTPHWILVDKYGIVVYSIFGSDPNNALLRLDLKISELLNT